MSFMEVFSCSKNVNMFVNKIRNASLLRYLYDLTLSSIYLIPINQTSL